MVNVDEIRSALAEHFPQWTGWIDRLEIKDAVGVRPVSASKSVKSRRPCPAFHFVRRSPAGEEETVTVKFQTPL